MALALVVAGCTTAGVGLGAATRETTLYVKPINAPPIGREAILVATEALKEKLRGLGHRITDQRPTGTGGTVVVTSFATLRLPLATKVRLDGAAIGSCAMTSALRPTSAGTPIDEARSRIRARFTQVTQEGEIPASAVTAVLDACVAAQAEQISRHLRGSGL